MITFSSSLLPTPMLRLASVRTELLWIYDGLVLPANRYVHDDHRYGYWVWLLHNGEVRVRMADREWEAKAGSWMVSPHGAIIQSFSADARILSVHFRCQWPTGENLFAEEDALIVDAVKYPRLQRTGSRLQALADRLFPETRIEFQTRTADFPVFLRLQQRFLEWLINFYDMMIAEGRTLAHFGSCDERLLRAMLCLHDTPLQYPFPAGQLQRTTSLGRAQLDRLFCEEFGTTVRVYWERLKLDSAMSMLETTEIPVKEIAYNLGFKQASHFTRWFSQRVEITPQAFRSQRAADYFKPIVTVRI
ncbi:MAG: helix-turn-helix transcriptional regulator [Chthoniobacteraceae bacterium]|nr:helix-turn-helix transcriptional regulator [Chthoniobacteraceae bacterium]